MDVWVKGGRGELVGCFWNGLIWMRRYGMAWRMKDLGWGVVDGVEKGGKGRREVMAAERGVGYFPVYGEDWGGAYRFVGLR